MAQTELELKRENKALMEAATHGAARQMDAFIAGCLVGAAQEAPLGELMGHDVSSDVFLPVMSLVIDKATGGKPPGGIAGDMCRVVHLAGQITTADAGKALTRGAIGFAKQKLLSGKNTVKNGVIDG